VGGDYFENLCLQAFITLQNQNKKIALSAQKIVSTKKLRIKVNGNKALRQIAA